MEEVEVERPKDVEQDCWMRYRELILVCGYVSIHQ